MHDLCYIAICDGWTEAGRKHKNVHSWEFGSSLWKLRIRCDECALKLKLAHWRISSENYSYSRFWNIQIEKFRCCVICSNHSCIRHGWSIQLVCTLRQALPLHIAQHQNISFRLFHFSSWEANFHFYPCRCEHNAALHQPIDTQIHMISCIILLSICVVDISVFGVVVVVFAVSFVANLVFFRFPLHFKVNIDLIHFDSRRNKFSRRIHFIRLSFHV